ncbi:MAG: shikimate kinase [Ruminococcaceae bacterium]|nr:shikimate kinase [Oscillospiraceae bacterium]
MNKENIILIGMPGCGKSTLGVLLAKLLCKDFLDADLVIQRQIGMPLQQYIDQKGVDAFLAAEADVICGLQAENTVIATGGSAPLLPCAARKLKELGSVVFLDLPCPEIEKRIHDLATRGIAMQPGETLSDIYESRRPLYLKLADLIFVPNSSDIAQTAIRLAEALKK